MCALTSERLPYQIVVVACLAVGAAICLYEATRGRR